MLDYQPSSEKIFTLQTGWQEKVDVHPGAQGPILNGIAANFVLSDVKTTDLLTGNVSWFNRNSCMFIENSAANYNHLADITRVLSDDLDPHMIEISRLVVLIGDFDVIARTRIIPASQELSQPVEYYHGQFKGSLKFRHPDFLLLRKSLAHYLSVMDQNQRFSVEVYLAAFRRELDLYSFRGKNEPSVNILEQLSEARSVLEKVSSIS